MKIKICRKRIQIPINNNCRLCQQSLKSFRDYPLKKNDIIIIVPVIDFHGKITSYHIGRALQCNIKDTKIFKDLEVDKNEKFSN